MVDPRAAVLAGVGQRKQKPADPATAVEPLVLMQEAVAAAVEDAGAPGLAGRADLVVVLKGFWRYSNPARLVADAFGATHARTALTEDGGNTPQALVNQLSSRIAAGQLDVAVIVGAEGVWSRRRARALGDQRPKPTVQTDSEPEERYGTVLPMSTPLEVAHGLQAPIHYYPLFETALRHHLGEKPDEHLARVAALWARFNEVAVGNPYAWLRTPMTAAEIAAPSAGNRMVNYPYTKAMNSNWDLDQSAALILCSAEAAEAAGVLKDRWIFPHAGADASDTPAVSNRDLLYESPAIRLAGQRTFELAGAGPDDLGPLDIYSCFPSAVEIAVRELGLDEDRPLTVTGGNTFAGGPGNNYVTHSIAAMAEVLRGRPDELGLVTANGGYLTKHAMGVYGARPPTSGFRAESVQAAVDELPTRECTDEHDGEVTVEAYTVMHGQDGPERALFATLLPDGRRAWGHSCDPDVMAAVMTDDAVGWAAIRESSGQLRLEK